jgi:hypothetical protein
LPAKPCNTENAYLESAAIVPGGRFNFEIIQYFIKREIIVVKYLKPIVLGLAAAGVVAYADPSVASLQSQLDQLQARVNSMSAGSSSMGVHTNAALTQSLLGMNGAVGNVETLMGAQKSGSLADGVTVGGFAQATATYEKVSDVPAGNQASYATHVTNMNSTTDTSTTGNATQVALPRAEMDVIANMNDWSVGYFSFGVRNLSGGTSDNDDLAIDSAVVTLGNMNQMPVYAFLGRNTVDFGSFDTVNMVTPSLNRLAFQAYGDQLGVGFMGYGFNAAVSALNDNNTVGGVNGQGVAFNTYTDNSDAVGNYAVNLGYGMSTAGADWHVGAGYLEGSKKRDANDESGAYDLNAKVGYMGFDVLGEFTQTTGAVLDANNNAANDKLRAWDLGADYNFPLMGKASKVNVDYSRVSAQYVASQWVVGFNHNTFNNVWMGLEYSQSKGRFVGGGSVYTAASSTTSTTVQVPTAVGKDASDMALLFDVQGVF